MDRSSELFPFGAPDAESRPGPVRRRYNRISGAAGGWIWGLLVTALAGSLVLSAVESSREARHLQEQMERLREDIQMIERRNERLDGRQ